MLVVVRRPHTEFSLNGDVPRKLIQSLVSEYGPVDILPGQARGDSCPNPCRRARFTPFMRSYEA